jgi:hypothetical protein
MNDEFVFVALGAIRELEEIVKQHRRPNYVLDALVNDLHAVTVRYLKAGLCAGPNCTAIATPARIETDSFCSDKCKAAKSASVAEEETRIAEAVAEHTGGNDG